jgi:hypothetical protein
LSFDIDTLSSLLIAVWLIVFWTAPPQT